MAEGSGAVGMSIERCRGRWGEGGVVSRFWKTNCRAIALAVLVSCLVSATSCGTDGPKSRRFTIRSGQLYVCLSKEIKASFPPQCGADFGADDQPRLTGTVAKKFLAEAGGDGTYLALAEVSGEELVGYSNLEVEWQPKE